FQEITRSAVQKALDEAGKIDMDRVRAQEARRILDRVVGFPLSGLLRRKVASGSSAGRGQSVALRLVGDRGREGEAVKPGEFRKTAALLAPAGTVPFAPKPFTVVLGKPRVEKDEKPEGPAVDKPEESKPEAAARAEDPAGTFRAELAEWAGRKFEAANQERALGIAAALDTAAYVVTSVEQKDTKDKVPP